ncbi:hypothetical protein [Streptomyces sp. XH2]|uniref:hypothetical protein n=1 Tax=Streptomyces sp. XH2 TaxID=3412483 RepID=UPI003C7A1D7A
MTSDAVSSLLQASSDLLDDYRAGIWWPTSHEQTVVTGLFRAGLFTARHIHGYRQLAGETTLSKGRLIGALQPAEAVLDAHDTTDGTPAHAALDRFQMLIDTLATDEQGHSIRPSRQELHVRGTITLTWDAGLSRIPLECPQCHARTNATLTVTDGSVTYTCSAQHTSPDHRLDAESVEAAIGSMLGFHRVLGDLALPGAPSPTPS